MVVGEVEYQDTYEKNVAPVRGKRRAPGLKRIFDFSMALILVAPISAVLLPAALVVKLTSQGPVFFRQHRYGRGKRPFVILKLRTMTVSENGDDFRQVVKGDVRITRVGRFLRTTSLDELPQIFNVLRGEMSLVGPRPHAIKHDDDFRKSVPDYDERFRVRPGITGLAQVRGQRGPTETVEAMTKRIESDLEYVAQVSVWKDIKILVQTVWVVLCGRNAF
jgi:putative colanic acid biosynthesis UDP-glucose lipid carrier transferase